MCSGSSFSRPLLRMALQPFFESHIAVASLTDDLVQEILLRLPSPASLARAALASKRWLGLASTPDFLRRFRARHVSSPLLGLFVSQGGCSGFPVFHPAAPVRSDPDLASAVRGGDFSLTLIGEDEDLWRLRDCCNGRLLLRRGRSLAVYDPVSRRRVSIRQPQDVPLSDSETYIADCLFHGRGDNGAAAFSVVSVRHYGRRMRAAEYNSGTREWSFHRWSEMENIRRPLGQAMQAAGLIFWKYDENSGLLLDTRTMEFSMLRLPVSFFHPSKYAIGEIEDGVCCLVCLDGTMDGLHMQVWLLMDNGGGKRWELEKEIPVSQVFGTGRLVRVRQVRSVASGFVLLSWDDRYPHFAIDLKNLKVTAEFMCFGLAYLYQFPWPPSVLVDHEVQQVNLAPLQSVELGSFVYPLQMTATQNMHLHTLVNGVNLSAERTMTNSAEPLDMVLGPHCPQDKQKFIAGEGETFVEIADLKLLMAPEAQNQSEFEKPEDQIRKRSEIPILWKSARLAKRRGGRYENVLHKAMERKAQYMDGVEQLTTSPIKKHLSILQMTATQNMHLHTLVNGVNLSAERTMTTNSVEPLDMVLGPHCPQDKQKFIAGEEETFVEIADLKLLMAPEAQNQSEVEKPEDQIRKRSEIPILWKSARLAKGRGGRYENVLHKAMERKARYMDGVAQLTTPVKKHL